MRVLDVSRRSPAAAMLLEGLDKQIVGQDEAKHILVDIVESYQAGFNDPKRPAGNALFLGPTGVGKTETIMAACRTLFGDERACIKIDCAEYQHGHEIAKLVGSPPGYLGHRETHPLLTQEALNAYHTDKLKLSIVLFDEIEKASDTLWQLLLGILDKATLTLGDNRRIDFSKVIIIMTSNIGSTQISELTNGSLGFGSKVIAEALLDGKVDTVAKEAAKKKFSPEFYNRINHTAVFRTLTPEQIESILKIELDNLQSRLWFLADRKFFFHLRKRATSIVLKEGFSKVYGARHLKRAVERRILTPLSRLVASGQIVDNDSVVIDAEDNGDFTYSLANAEGA